nr:MAG TPA_asm: hypothetical protein [Caudoviricetes sp.]
MQESLPALKQRDDDAPDQGAVILCRQSQNSGVALLITVNSNRLRLP